ncbi:MAG: hypothetical protein NTW04_01655 [Elusimicrobia bacterium]|nr:hypothetical protein [Elusimicrobiota bacterium]
MERSGGVEYIKQIMSGIEERKNPAAPASLPKIRGAMAKLLGVVSLEIERRSKLRPGEQLRLCQKGEGVEKIIEALADELERSLVEIKTPALEGIKEFLLEKSSELVKHEQKKISAVYDERKKLLEARGQFGGEE